ncbi:MAG: 2OG-Fe(II) oxygenase [Terriglobia bacterium]
MINGAVLRQASRYRSEFQSARPFPHVMIDDFFNAERAEQLLADFPPFDPANAGNEFGGIGRKATIPDIRKISPFYAAVYDYIASREFLDFVAEATGIPDLIHDELMFGGGTHENLAGQDLDPHVDFNFIEDRQLHRRLNLLLYLNKEWEVSWGGCLEFHTNPRRWNENQIKVVAPLFNRGVIFETSERSWHGFEQIRLPEGKKHLSRKMLSIYLYTRDRPAEEIAPPHGTFYVQRPLPGHLAAGHTLTGEDVFQLKDMLWRRDTWIEIYQKKELADSRRIQDLVNFARQFPQVPLSGDGVQEGQALGIWPDGWIGSPFEVAIRLRMPADSLLVEGYLPEQTLPGMELRASVNDAVVSRGKFEPGEISLSVPAEASAGDLVKLGIISDRSYCPRRSGASADGRELVMVLKEIRVLRGATARD